MRYPAGGAWLFCRGKKADTLPPYGHPSARRNSSVYVKTYFSSKSQQPLWRGLGFLRRMSMRSSSRSWMLTSAALQGGTMISPSHSISLQLGTAFFAARAGPRISAVRHFWIRHWSKIFWAMMQVSPFVVSAPPTQPQSQSQLLLQLQLQLLLQSELQLLLQFLALKSNSKAPILTASFNLFVSSTYYVTRGNG